MIFYFSATGNSKYAADKIADATNDKTVSIGDAFRNGHFAYDVSQESQIGFVVPTFAWTLPGIVGLFLEKLELTGYQNPYVFGVFTCGESTGHESAALNTMLTTKGLHFSGGFDLVMPDNFIVWSEVPSPARLEAKLNSADEKLALIIDAIRAKKPGVVGTGKPENLYMPLENISTAKGTSKLHADDKCTTCGLCVSLCPMSCIKTDDNNRPVWEGTCTICLACLHRCPAQAIQYGNDTQKKGRYVNPRVKP